MCLTVKVKKKPTKKNSKFKSSKNPKRKRTIALSNGVVIKSSRTESGIVLTKIIKNTNK